MQISVTFYFKAYIGESENVVNRYKTLIKIQTRLSSLLAGRENQQ